MRMLYLFFSEMESNRSSYSLETLEIEIGIKERTSMHKLKLLLLNMYFRFFQMD